METQHFVYHPHHEPVIVSGAEYQHYLENGWYDTPAKFPNALSQKEDAESNDNAPKKKGRPPKVKQEEPNEIDAA